VALFSEAGLPDGIMYLLHTSNPTFGICIFERLRYRNFLNGMMVFLYFTQCLYKSGVLLRLGTNYLSLVSWTNKSGQP
jgi:hypothetical protein